MVKDAAIYRDSGEINDTIKYIFHKKNKENLLPIYTKHGYTMDWKIIGENFEKYYCFSNDVDFTGPIKLPNVTFETWYNSIKPVRELVRWLSTRLFFPNRIIGSNRETDQVLLRIGVSKLNNIDLPNQVKDEMFDNLIQIYYDRKELYNDFYYQYILDLPF